MLSFSDCRIVRALISELLVGTIILLRTSESEADASVRHREVQYDICAGRHLFTLLFKKCSLLLIVISPDGNTGFVMPERKCVTGAAGGCQCPRTSSLFPLRGGHHDR